MAEQSPQPVQIGAADVLLRDYINATLHPERKVGYEPDTEVLLDHFSNILDADVAHAEREGYITDMEVIVNRLLRTEYFARDRVKDVLSAPGWLSRQRGVILRAVDARYGQVLLYLARSWTFDRDIPEVRDRRTAVGDNKLAALAAMGELVALLEQFVTIESKGAQTRIDIEVEAIINTLFY